VVLTGAHAAAQIHYSSRQRGSDMVAYGACAAN
jgi:hypothetical protein